MYKRQEQGQEYSKHAGVISAFGRDIEMCIRDRGILGPTLGVIGGATLQLLILLPGLFDRNGHIAMAFNFADERDVYKRQCLIN